MWYSKANTNIWCHDSNGNASVSDINSYIPNVYLDISTKHSMIISAFITFNHINNIIYGEIKNSNPSHTIKAIITFKI